MLCQHTFYGHDTKLTSDSNRIECHPVFCEANETILFHLSFTLPSIVSLAPLPNSFNPRFSRLVLLIHYTISYTINPSVGLLTTLTDCIVYLEMNQIIK